MENSAAAWASEANSSRVALGPARPVSPDGDEKKCRCCELADATLYCPRCQAKYCDDCWTNTLSHRREAPGHDPRNLDGSPAEHPAAAFQNLKQALNPGWADDVRAEQHRLDYCSLWFAVTQSHDGSLSFEEHPRFRLLMEEHARQDTTQPTHYPRLASFVGGTGAGKSTLIRILVGHLWDVNSTTDASVPVVGDPESVVPTSSDVHLYRDPVAHPGLPEAPLLYADCEGFEGANQSSAAAQTVERARHAHLSGSSSSWVLQVWQAAKRAIRHTLHWAKPHLHQRQSAVEQLFPRLLYTFSDVVVYVITETEIKKSGSVLERLVKWSLTSDTAGLNRVTLPSLIVAINQSDPSGRVWDPETTTDRIIKQNQGMMENNPTIMARKSQLEELGRPTRDLQDLLKYSYRSIEFIRIPRNGAWSLLAAQAKRLYDMIQEATKQTHQAKLSSKMELDSNNLDLFYRLAFEHFSKDKDAPFDFIKTILSLHPPSTDFASSFFNILVGTFKVVKEMGLPISCAPRDLKSEGSGTETEPKTLGSVLCNAVIPVILSAVAIDVHRSIGRIPGPLLSLIQGASLETLEHDLTGREMSYEEIINAAFNKFCDKAVQCEFTAEVAGEMRRCVNLKHAHDAGHAHQDASGKKIGIGSFESSFEHGLGHHWMEALTHTSDYLHAGRTWLELKVFRRDSIRNLYQQAPGLHFPRLSGCFWCLRAMPTERLPCGHWICESCLREVGEPSSNDDRLFLLSQCDRHPGGQDLSPSFEFFSPPSGLGRRLLCLDEGGARSIVELYVLEAVQKRLGEDIALQDCFDLIGGSGAGGVIALGLALGGWSLSDALAKFRQFTPVAFTKLSWWDHSRSWWSLLYQDSMGIYGPANLRKGIQGAFGERGLGWMADSMYKQGDTGKGPTRVFVTSCVKDQRGEVLTNYLRRRTLDRTQTQHGPAIHAFSCDLKIEEAARATCSIPEFFGSFQARGGPEYVGGAPDFSIPAEVTLLEARHLWPHALNPDPDILLSVGSGYPRKDVARYLKPLVAWTSPVRCVDAQKRWIDAFEQRSQTSPDRYIRLCPALPSAISPPDTVKYLMNGHLERSTSDFLEEDSRQGNIQGGVGSKIDLIVRRIVSTTFYFDQQSRSLDDSECLISGAIRCRYKHNSDMAKAFGRRIGGLKSPRFVLESTKPYQSWSFTEIDLNYMTSHGVLHIPIEFSIPETAATVDIRFVADEVSAESISGCPFQIDSIQGPEAADS